MSESIGSIGITGPIITCYTDRYNKFEIVNQYYRILVTTCDHTIAFFGEMNQMLAMDLKTAFLHLLKDSECKEINLTIHSDGGSTEPAFASVDMIQALLLSHPELHLNTIAIGRCASAAVLLLMCGHKRMMAQNSYLFLHNVICASYLNPDVLTMNVENMYVSSICTKTGIASNTIERLMDNDTFIFTHEALHYGLIHEVWPINTPPIVPTGSLMRFRLKRLIQDPIFKLISWSTVIFTTVEIVQYYRRSQPIVECVK